MTRILSRLAPAPLLFSSVLIVRREAENVKRGFALQGLVEVPRYKILSNYFWGRVNLHFGYALHP